MQGIPIAEFEQLCEYGRQLQQLNQKYAVYPCYLIPKLCSKITTTILGT